MKKINIFRNILPAAFALLAGMFVACDNEEMPAGPDTSNGKVPLVVKMGGVYTHLPASSRAADNPQLTDGMIRDLQIGATLRLIILKDKLPDSQYGLKDTDILADTLTYVVDTDEGGSESLYPCEVYDNGDIIPGTKSLEPYYLDADGVTRYCMAISPAKRLVNVDGNMMVAVKNQETLLTTNNHWTQTRYSEFSVPTDVQQSSVVKLNPLMHATARIRVTVTSDQSISRIQPTEPFVELSRVPADPGLTWQGDVADGGAFHTQPAQNLVIGDVIQKQMGNNILDNRIYIHKDECREAYVEDTFTSGTAQVPYTRSEVVAETTMLPMDARPTPMIIRLNVMVDKTPMQFQYQTGLLFEPGHSYNFKATLTHKNSSIYIAAWQDASWETTVKPD